MKKLVIAIPVLLIVILAAALLTSPTADTSPVVVDVPLDSLQQK